MKETKEIQIRSSFAEADKPSTQKAKFKVVLIQEGLGNLNDCFYYTKGSLKVSAGIFEGKKCYANHPDKMEEEIRPERAVDDILGHFENVEYKESSDGRGYLQADLVTLPDPSYSWARALLMSSIDYARKFTDSEFVGLSINANGEANEVSIQDFMKESDLPDSVVPKLIKAQAEGIDSIRVVNSLKDAISVDLVTEAGAGGKILQMLESEREKNMKQKKEKEESEAKKKEMEKKKKESEGEDHKEDDGQTDHADVDKDKELFAQMIKQYLGDDHQEDEAAHEMAKEAYEAYQAEGLEHEAAYEAAGKHLKMAKAIGSKMHQKKAEAEKHEKESEGENEAHKEDGFPPPKDGDADTDDEAPPKKKKQIETHYESGVNFKVELIRAKAQIAKLTESLKKYELAEYLDKKLKESKEPVHVTTKFREALGYPRSKEQIDSSLKLFLAAYKTGTEGSDDYSAFVMTEKNVIRESSESSVGTLEDCVN